MELCPESTTKLVDFPQEKLDKTEDFVIKKPGICIFSNIISVNLYRNSLLWSGGSEKRTGKDFESVLRIFE